MDQTVDYNNLELQEQSSQSSLTSSLLSEAQLSVSNIQIQKQKLKKSKTIKKALEERAENQLIYDQSTSVMKIIKINDDNFNNSNIQKATNASCFPVIKPKSIVLWKICIALLIIFLFFEVPIFVMFGTEFWKDILSERGREALFYGILFLLVIDMGLDFITAYYKHGNLITNSVMIANHYLYGYFMFDCIALITSIVRLSVISDEYRFVFFFFYFKFPSLLQIDHQIGEIILLHKSLRTLYQVSKMLIFMFFCFNFFGCIWYKIGIYANNSNLDSWLNTDGNFGIIVDLPIHQVYFFSFYFSLATVSTTMGYGDIQPMNIYECSFCLLGIMFAIMVFALNINNFQTMMQEYHANDISIFKQKVCINKYMDLKNVPSEFRERIRQYLNEYWYQEFQRDQETEQQIFSILAPELKQDLLYYSNGKMLQQTMFGKHFSKNLLKSLSQRIQEISYSTGDVIVYDKAEMDDQSFYFIIGGEILMTPGNSVVYRKKLTANDSFGEWSFFTGFPRTATAKAIVYSQLLKLSRIDFLEVLQKYPNDYEQYCEIRDSILFSKDYAIVEQPCWTCNKYDHHAIDCPNTHYQPPVQELIENTTILDMTQVRMKIERFHRNQWPTRVNSKSLVQGLNKNRLKKQVNQMLKTQKALQVIKNDVSIKVSVDSEQSLLKRADSGEVVEQPKYLDKYKQIEQPTIHKGQANFDAPANFKNYFSKFNSSNYEAFKGMEIMRQERIIDVRKSVIRKQ